MIWLLYATSLLSGFLFMAGSMWLAFKSMQAHKAGNVDAPGEFEVEVKFIKIKSSYPMLGMALVGALLVLYPIYDYSGKGQQPVSVAGKVVIVPADAINDAVIRVMFGPWDLHADSDGKLNTSVQPDVKRFRVEVQAPGRPILVKTVTITETGTADVGDLNVAPPTIQYAPPATVHADTSGLPGLDKAGEAPQ